MDKKDKKEFVVLISDAINDVVIPALEGMEKRLTKDLASKKDIKGLEMKFDSHDRKFNAQQDRMDRHGKKLENHEKRIHKLEASL